jgi:hypothetical protein
MGDPLSDFDMKGKKRKGAPFRSMQSRFESTLRDRKLVSTRADVESFNRS